jgi:hypothetical protein
LWEIFLCRRTRWKISFTRIQLRYRASAPSPAGQYSDARLNLRILKIGVALWSGLQKARWTLLHIFKRNKTLFYEFCPVFKQFKTYTPIDVYINAQMWVFLKI